MVSSVISFRVSGELLEWLESERHDDLNESLGEAARRLLNRNICKPSVDIVDEQISDPIFDRFEQIEVRLSKLEQSSDFGFSEGAKQLTIFDALEEVEASLKSSGALDGFSIEEEENYLLKEDLDKIRADYDSLLESSDRIISNLRAEMYQLRSKLDIERADREEVETELSDMGKICTELRSENFQFKHDSVVDRELPEAGDLLNQLKAWRKKSKSDLTDVVKILEILDL